MFIEQSLVVHLKRVLRRVPTVDSKILQIICYNLETVRNKMMNGKSHTGFRLTNTAQQMQVIIYQYKIV